MEKIYPSASGFWSAILRLTSFIGIVAYLKLLHYDVSEFLL